MYTDSSRIKDLEQIKGWLADPKKSIARKQMLHRTYKKIQAQLHDKKLANMRERLVKASQANDSYELWKITNQIKDYSGEELVGQKYE